VLRWQYHKDFDTPGGEDTGWLDELQITATTEAQPAITNLSLDANGLNATVQSLPASGNIVIESSSDLRAWTPVSTNQISGATFNLTRPTTNSEQFLRIRVQ
jgi:hypothetical protein